MTAPGESCAEQPIGPSISWSCFARSDCRTSSCPVISRRSMTRDLEMISYSWIDSTFSDLHCAQNIHSARCQYQSTTKARMVASTATPTAMPMVTPMDTPMEPMSTERRGPTAISQPGVIHKRATSSLVSQVKIEHPLNRRRNRLQLVLRQTAKAILEPGLEDPARADEEAGQL